MADKPMADEIEVKKEEFSVSLDDTALAEQIKAWKEESKEFYEELQRVISRNLEYYKGVQTDLHKVLGNQSRAVENRIFMAVEHIVPVVTSQPAQFMVAPPEDDEKGRMLADELQEVLGYHYDRIRLKEKLEVFAREVIVKRVGILKVYWNQGLDDWDVINVDPKRIKIPRLGRSVYDLAFLIEELELSFSQLEEYFGKEVANKLLEKKPGDTEQKIRKATWIVNEVWTNSFVAWEVGGEVVKKQDNPYFLNKGSNYFLFPQKPYVIKSLFHTSESLAGEVDLIQQSIPIQDNINILKRRIENLARKVSNPILAVDSEIMSEEQAQQISNEEGFILYGQGAAEENKLRFHSPGQVPQYLFTDLEFSRAQFDNIFGFHSTTRGERSKAPTLGQDILQRQGDLGRVDLITRQLERAVWEIGEWGTQLMKVFYNDKHVFRIMGAQGARVIEFNKEKIEDGVKVFVKSGSLLPQDEISIRNEALQLSNAQLIDPLTLYERLKWPNPQLALQRLNEWRAGILGQSAPANIKQQQLEGMVAPTATPGAEEAPSIPAPSEEEITPGVPVSAAVESAL